MSYLIRSSGDGQANETEFDQERIDVSFLAPGAGLTGSMWARKYSIIDE